MGLGDEVGEGVKESEGDGVGDGEREVPDITCMTGGGVMEGVREGVAVGEGELKRGTKGKDDKGVDVEGEGSCGYTPNPVEVDLPENVKLGEKLSDNDEAGEGRMGEGNPVNDLGALEWGVEENEPNLTDDAGERESPEIPLTAGEDEAVGEERLDLRMGEDERESASGGDAVGEAESEE